MTPAADVYALGTVLLYAAARHYPYDGATWEAVAVQVTNPDIGPNLKAVPEGLKPLISSMLAHAPESRPTLEAVAEECQKLVKSAGLTPADARLALIARTTVDGAPDAAKGPLSASFEKLLEERASDTGPDSPLDGLRADAETSEPETGDAEQKEQAPTSAEPVVSLKAESRPRDAGERPPASKRVADELRAEYAADAEL